MDAFDRFKAKLTLLESMLSKMDPTHIRVRQMKRNVIILRHIIRDPAAIRSPYGPVTPIVRFSIQ